MPAVSKGATAATPAPNDRFSIRNRPANDSSPRTVAFTYHRRTLRRYSRSDGGVPQAYPDLPGEWAGEPYDFVTGRDPQTREKVFGFPGLPIEVAGCLEGT